jgi:Fe-S cluster biogenesis protein NfuA
MSAATPASGALDAAALDAALDAAALEAAVLDRIAAQVRPLLRLHGGDCELVDIADGVVRIRFLMACTACKLRPLTLLAAIRPRLLALDGVVDVRAVGVGVSKAAMRRVDAAWGLTTDPARLLPLHQAPIQHAPIQHASTQQEPPSQDHTHQQPTRQQPARHLATQARNGKT